MVPSYSIGAVKVPDVLANGSAAVTSIQSVEL